MHVIIKNISVNRNAQRERKNKLGVINKKKTQKHSIQKDKSFPQLATIWRTSRLGDLLLKMNMTNIRTESNKQAAAFSPLFLHNL